MEWLAVISLVGLAIFEALSYLYHRRTLEARINDLRQEMEWRISEVRHEMYVLEYSRSHSADGQEVP